MSPFSSLGIWFKSKFTPKHFTSTFCIGTSDDRRVHVEEMILVEELVNHKTHGTSHSENRPEKIGSESKMRLLTKNFQRVFFRLKNSFSISSEKLSPRIVIFWQ